MPLERAGAPPAILSLSEEFCIARDFRRERVGKTLAMFYGADPG